MSDKPVAERLQVRNDRRLAVLGASCGLDGAVGAVDARTELPTADVVLLVVCDHAGLTATLPTTLAQIREGAILWLAYPKLSSSLASDLSRDTIRSIVPHYGHDTVSQIAIDADWSALRLKRV